jgi:predicted amidohydrolase
VLVDLLIRNGTVIDPARGYHGVANVGISKGRIVEVGSTGVEGRREIDADGYLVVPGLIDSHAHVFSPGTEFGIRADSSLLPQGVTSMIDGGSAGVANYEGFVRTVVAFNQVRVFSLVNVALTGQMTLRYDENVDPKHFDVDTLADLFAKYGGQLLGLKIRMGAEIVGELGLEPLKATLAMAEQIGCPVVVHVSNPPCTQDKIAELLRPGDVFCHCFHGRGWSIVDPEGHVLPAIKEAKRRGVYFDAANGRLNFRFAVAKAAIADGFRPDIYSTDLTTGTAYWDYSFGLPYVMSKYLALGVDLTDVIAACTATPAKQMRKEGIIGTLSPGALGDVTVLKLSQRETRFLDHVGESCGGDKLLVPQMTVVSGAILYRQIDFAT